MSSSKNLEYKKTSFLSKYNNSFIEDMYVRFVEKDPTLPKSWKEYFIDLGDDFELITQEIKGPTWNPKKININIKKEKKIIPTSNTSNSSEKEKLNQSKQLQ